MYDYTTAFHFGALGTIYYISMFFITLHKLAEVTLNIRLPVYWNTQRAKLLVTITWLLGATFGVSIVLAFAFAQLDFNRVLFYFLFPALDVAFILLAVPTYLFLFRTFKLSRSQGPAGVELKGKKGEGDGGGETGWWRAFRESTFYTVFLLVSVFILLVVIPDFIFLFARLPKMTDHHVRAGALLRREISFIFDAVIYMLTIREVKRQLTRKFHALQCCSTDDGELGKQKISSNY